MRTSIYRIFETNAFLADLEGLPENRRDKIREKIKNGIYPLLRQQPHFGTHIKKLRDRVPETWRFRVGEWRLFYELDEAEMTVFLIAFDMRRDAY